MKDYEFEITGGSDNAGFPLNKSFDSSVRKRILIKSKKGIKRRKNVRGNTFGGYMAQISLKVVKYGSSGLDKLIGVEKKKGEEEKKEEKTVEKPKDEVKEQPKIEEKKE